MRSIDGCDRLRVAGLAEADMAFTIHASKNFRVMKTLRLDPRSAADKARVLLDQGWDVYVTDQSGQRYSFDAPEGLQLADVRREAWA